MLHKIKIETEVDLQTLVVNASVRYWEDSEVNGVEDTVNGDNIPCKNGDTWNPCIEIDTGIITNWKQGVKAEIHYKVCDGCAWSLKDKEGEVVLYEMDGYVPKTLCPKEAGYGDYIIMDVDENGQIADWEFNIGDFTTDEEED